MALQLKVPSMACSVCAETIAKAVNGLDPAAKVEADPATKWVTVETQVAETAIRAAIAAAGYPID